jgi:hypothetical protein
MWRGKLVNKASRKGLADAVSHAVRIRVVGPKRRGGAWELSVLCVFKPASAGIRVGLVEQVGRNKYPVADHAVGGVAGLLDDPKRARLPLLS